MPVFDDNGESYLCKSCFEKKRNDGKELSASKWRKEVNRAYARTHTSLERMPPLAPTLSNGIFCRPFAVDHCIGYVTLYFGRMTSWPAARRVNKVTKMILHAAWAAARAQPRAWLLSRNERCTGCGWWSGELEANEDLCVLCGNTGVCRERCTYRSTDDGLQYCIECESRPGVPPIRTTMTQFLT